MKIHDASCIRLSLVSLGRPYQTALTNLNVSSSCHASTISLTTYGPLFLQKSLFLYKISLAVRRKNQGMRLWGQMNDFGTILLRGLMKVSRTHKTWQQHKRRLLQASSELQCPTPNIDTWNSKPTLMVTLCSPLTIRTLMAGYSSLMDFRPFSTTARRAFYKIKSSLCHTIGQKSRPEKGPILW